MVSQAPPHLRDRDCGRFSTVDGCEKPGIPAVPRARSKIIPFSIARLPCKASVVHANQRPGSRAAGDKAVRAWLTLPGWKYRNSSVCPSTKSSSRNPVQVKGKVPTPKALPLRDEAGAALRHRL